MTQTKEEKVAASRLANEDILLLQFSVDVMHRAGELMFQAQAAGDIDFVRDESFANLIGVRASLAAAVRDVAAEPKDDRRHRAVWKAAVDLAAWTMLFATKGDDEWKEYLPAKGRLKTVEEAEA